MRWFIRSNWRYFDRRNNLKRTRIFASARETWAKALALLHMIDARSGVRRICTGWSLQLENAPPRNRNTSGRNAGRWAPIAIFLAKAKVAVSISSFKFFFSFFASVVVLRLGDEIPGWALRY